MQSGFSKIQSFPCRISHKMSVFPTITILLACSRRQSGSPRANTAALTENSFLFTRPQLFEIFAANKVLYTFIRLRHSKHENYERRPPSASNCTRRAPPVYLSRRKNNEFRYAFGGTFFRSPYAASDNECLFPTRRPLPDTA